MHEETIRIQLNYPLERVEEPILYQLIRDYQLVPNIRRADMDVRTGGYLFLELTGTQENLDRALNFLDAIGVEVNTIGLDGSEEWAL